MSATRRGANPHRPADDFRETPPWAVHRLLDQLYLPPGQWLEPAAGDGAIIKATGSWLNRRFSPNWDACELRAEAAPALRKLSLDQLHCPTSFFDLAGEWDVIKSNPPFSFAQQYIEHALPMASFVVMFLRLNFLGSAERQKFFSTQMPDIYALPNRPVMGLNKLGKLGTDATEYGWFVWPPERDRHHGKIQVLGLTDPQEIKVANRALAKKLGLAA